MRCDIDAVQQLVEEGEPLAAHAGPFTAHTQAYGLGNNAKLGHPCTKETY